MKLGDIINDVSLDVKTCNVCLDSVITGAYVSDLLSDVMANAKDGNVWITLQTHLNIVAVASLKGVKGIIIVNSRRVDEAVLKKAEEEGVAIMVTPLSAFEVAGKVYQLLK
ncbi:MAG: serine kinase [Nitrospirae bacterium]|nr:serine kinase [Nitrospirota bacterium]